MALPELLELPDWLQGLIDEDAPDAEIARRIYLPDPDDPEWFCEDRSLEELEDPKDRREAGHYLTWLADALRAGGCRVIEVSGWQIRGHGSMRDIRGTLNHHTGGGGVNDWRVVLNGRADLPGPLAHMTLEKNGTFRVIAAGRCWHAGSGGPLGPVPAGAGNNHLIGIEGVSNGSSWTHEQRVEYARGVAALLRHLRLGADRTWDHKEWTRRKIDRGVWDPNHFRHVEVPRYLATTQGDDMPGWHEPLAQDWAGNPQSLRGTFDHIDRRTVELEKKVDHLTRRLDETATAIVGMHQELMTALKSSHGEPVDPS